MVVETCLAWGGGGLCRCLKAVTLTHCDHLSCFNNRGGGGGGAGVLRPLLSLTATTPPVSTTGGGGGGDCAGVSLSLTATTP